MKSTQFSLEEQQLIVETLLFAVGADICAEWTPKQEQMMLEIALKLNNPDNKLTSVYLFEGGPFDRPETVERIKSGFPNLPRTSIITD